MKTVHASAPEVSYRQEGDCNGIPMVRKAILCRRPVPKPGSCRWIVFVSIWLVVLCSGLGSKYLHPVLLPIEAQLSPSSSRGSILALRTLKSGLEVRRMHHVHVNILRHLSCALCVFSHDADSYPRSTHKLLAVVWREGDRDGLRPTKTSRNKKSNPPGSIRQSHKK
jgi:hypothetical protein